MLLKRTMQHFKGTVPGLYRTIKYAVSYISYLSQIISKKNGNSKQVKDIQCISIDSYKNTFFGYYDMSTFNPSNNNLILLHANNANPLRKPNPKVNTDILLYDLKRKTLIKKIGETTSWNWQQGARLHWLNENKLIYNVFNKELNKYNACIHNLTDKTYKYVPFPVQDSFKDEYIISIDYTALNHSRPDYGYRNIKTPFHHKIYLYSLKTGISEVLVETTELAKDIVGDDNYYKTRFYVNHVHISPCGTKFIYLFRYYLNYNQYHLLYLYDLKNRINNILITDEKISHYKWLNNQEFIYWGSNSGKLDYHIVNIETNHVKWLNTGLKDGHPSIFDHNHIITDSYPNKKGEKKLYKVNIDTGLYQELASFYDPPMFFGETRCDLHPNVCQQTQTVNIDTIVNKKRTLCFLGL